MLHWIFSQQSYSLISRILLPVGHPIPPCNVGHDGMNHSYAARRTVNSTTRLLNSITRPPVLEGQGEWGSILTESKMTSFHIFMFFGFALKTTVLLCGILLSQVNMAHKSLRKGHCTVSGFFLCPRERVFAVPIKKTLCTVTVLWQMQWIRIVPIQKIEQTLHFLALWHFTFYFWITVIHWRDVEQCLLSISQDY